MKSPDIDNIRARGLIRDQQIVNRDEVLTNLESNGNAGPFEQRIIEYDSLLRSQNYTPLARRRAARQTRINLAFGSELGKVYKAWSKKHQI